MIVIYFLHIYAKISFVSDNKCENNLFENTEISLLNFIKISIKWLIHTLIFYGHLTYGSTYKTISLVVRFIEFIKL